MSDCKIFLDRYILEFQKDRERSDPGATTPKRTLQPLAWEQIVANLPACAREEYEINQHRHFGIVDVAIDDAARVPHTIIECGVFNPGELPAAWKRGERSVKQMRVAGGYQWFHPARIAVPKVGNQIVVQCTRTGPGIKDICGWLKVFLGVNFVDFTIQAPVKFRTAFSRTRDFKLATFNLVRTDRTVGGQIQLDEAAAAREMQAERFVIVLRPDRDSRLSKSSISTFLGKVLAGWQSNAATYDYQLEDAELVPGTSDAVNNILKLSRDTRSQYTVRAGSVGEPQATEVIRVLAEDLTAWLAP